MPDTIEALARLMVKTMANKTDFECLEKEVGGIKKSMDENFEEVFKRLDRIEDVLLESHNNRITQLESDVNPPTKFGGRVKELRELLKV